MAKATVSEDEYSNLTKEEIRFVDFDYHLKINDKMFQSLIIELFESGKKLASF